MIHDDALLEERNLIAQALARMAQRAGYRVGVRPAPDEDGWRLLVVDLPGGRIAWRIPIGELGDLWPRYPEEIEDAPRPEERRDRLARFIRGDFGMRCWICGEPFEPPREQIERWLRSGRGYDPTDWECERCGWLSDPAILEER